MSRKKVIKEVEQVIMDAGQKIRQEEEARANLLTALAKVVDSLKSLYESGSEKPDGYYEKMLEG